MTQQATPIEPGTILTRAEIKPLLGNSEYGGICPAVEQHNVLLFSDEEAGAGYGYKDGWLEEEDEFGPIFEYTGAGGRDQVFGGRYGAGNLAVLRHAEMKRTLHLFIAVGKVQGTNTKRHRYIGVFRLDEAQPYVVRQTPGVGGAPRKAIIFRLRPAGPYERLAADQIEEAHSTTATLVPADVTTSKMVEPERNGTKQSKRSAMRETVAHRREAELSDALEEHLKAQGHSVGRYQIKIKGSTSTLLTDLYDATDHVLYEAKGVTTREAIRMGLGQLLDYRRHVHSDDHPGRPQVAVLLPSLPDEDLRELLREHDVAVVYRDLAGGTFRTAR